MGKLLYMVIKNKKIKNKIKINLKKK